MVERNVRDWRHDLKDILDVSSGVIRLSVIWFLIFQIYMLVIVGTTNNIQLLVPSGKVILPITNTAIPLLEFYIITPLIILFFHFVILINLFVYREIIRLE